jgi:O-Antigen ligase
MAMGTTPLGAARAQAGADGTGARALPGASVSLRGLQRGTLWLLMACSSIAFTEPSPYEFLFVLTLLVFSVTGLRFSARLIPLVLLLIIFNIGGIFSLIPFMDEPDSVRFIAVSVYLMITAVLFAAVMADDTLARLDTMRRGMLLAAWIAGIAGIAGYFNIAGTFDYFTRFGRAAGTFKDANVFGPFMILPVLFVVQRVLCGQTGAVRGLALLSVPLLAVFLSFSRGAWGSLAGGLVLCTALLFLTSASDRLRLRIVVMTCLGAFALGAALLFVLSFDSIAEMFNERASLVQDYDVGAQGRFGKLFYAIPMLLDLPNGFGPLRFRYTFPEDPHNVYINAFASYGWLGGISYIALVCVTCIAGWKVALQRTPWQREAIVIWSVLFVTILQGFQIDTDHWRHFYLMLGITWGLAALPVPRRNADDGLRPARS